MDKKIKVKHNPCGHEFKIRARFIQEKYLPCAACKTNSNEKLIAEFLKDKNIDFKTQYTFNELRGKKKQFLRFDFAVFKNNKIKFLLEYDGIQHFKAIDFFGGQEALEENKTRDKKKNYFCKTNNIKLIRIPYFEKDLTNFLNKLIRVEGLI
jgi:thioredoxin reductase